MPTHDITFTLKDEPLRDDVRLLGALLGDVLKEQGGDELFDRVEAARLAARRRRGGEQEAETELRALLTGLPPDEALDLVRAFSAYFDLVNLAERVHRIRRAREYRRGAPQPGSLRAVIAELDRRGIERARLIELIESLEVTPVFTAHPTEAVRRTLLTKEQRIARALVDRIDPQRITPEEDEAALGRVREEVTGAWQTEEHPGQRRTVADETENVAFYLADVVYRVAPVFYETFEKALAALDGPVDALSGRTVLSFGSWVGGDMDGNPNAGPATILATLTRQRELVIERYMGELKELFRRLSQSTSRVGSDAGVQERIKEYGESMPELQGGIPARYADMPYRKLLWLMSARLEVCVGDGQGGYAGPVDFLDDLRLMAGSLERHLGRHAGLHHVKRLIRRVETFGFHLATLDVRQDSAVHRRSVGQLLGVEDFEQRSADQRRKLLERALASDAGPPPGMDRAEQSGCIEVFKAIEQAQRRFGAGAIGPYIISMAQGVDDVLAVLWLARAGGLVDGDGRVRLDIAPLFETVTDLEASPDTLARMLAHPVYKEHLRHRRGEQLVMLGYSDSAKRAGVAASRWALYQAQERLAEVAKRAGTRLTLFHGRGGTVSRGGSKPRQAILADPPSVADGHLRLTEQGEIIRAKYGLRGIALRTLELMAGAALEASALAVEARPIPAEWPKAMSLIAEESRGAFRALVYEDSEFYAFFRAATPIDVIERLQIGSRPASRRSMRGIDDLRAIPWVFAWTQGRYMLPGWYGLGAALERALAEFGEETLRDMAEGWPLFGNLLADTDMVLAKADMGIAGLYAKLAVEAGERIFSIIEQEAGRTARLVRQLRGEAELLDSEPALKRAITLRNPYVDPMSLLQVDLLERWRASGRKDEELERALFATVRGISRGLQNTG